MNERLVSLEQSETFAKKVKQNDDNGQQKSKNILELGYTLTLYPLLQPYKVLSS